MRRIHLTRRAITVTIAAGITVTGSSGDGSAADSTTPSDTAYCEAALATESHQITGEESPEEIATFVEQYLEPQATLLPDGFADDVAVVRAAIEGELTGDFSEAIAADARIHAYSLTTCEWPVQPVVMVDHEFVGVPTSLSSGLTSFEVSNDGDEAHAMVLLRRNDDVTTPFPELIGLPEDEVLTMVEEIGNGVWLDPGTASYMVVPDLRPGDYAIVCPIPVGAARLEDVTHEDQHPTHLDLGMIHEFTVE